MEKTENVAYIRYTPPVPVPTKRRSVRLQSSLSEKRQRSILPKATMNIHSTSNNAAAKTESNKELDHEATVKCRFASIISKSKAVLCNNDSKKFDPKQEEATFKRSLLDDKPVMEAQSNVGMKRKRQIYNGRKKSDPQRRKMAVRETKADPQPSNQRRIRETKADPQPSNQHRIRETEADPQPSNQRRKMAVKETEANVLLKRQREKDRNAARMAIEKMQNTAGIERNVDIEKEFYILLGVSHSE